MERIIDLDLAAAEVIVRQPGWQAVGLVPGSVTWVQICPPAAEQNNNEFGLTSAP